MIFIHAPRTRKQLTQAAIAPGTRFNRLATERRGWIGTTHIHFSAQLSRLLLVLLCAFHVIAGVDGKAQSATLAGAMSSFGSSLTNAEAIAVDGSQNAYILTSAGAVYKETWNATAGTYTENLLFTASYTASTGIAVDSAGANIYIATGAGHSVSQYTGSGTSYAAGTTFSGFTGTTAVSVDASGDVYITDAAAGSL